VPERPILLIDENGRPIRDGLGDEPLLSLQAASRLLWLYPKTLLNWMRQGKVEGRKVGYRWKFRRRDLERIWTQAPRGVRRGHGQ
jgi:hypothetical protein